MRGEGAESEGAGREEGGVHKFLHLAIALGTIKSTKQAVKNRSCGAQSMHMVLSGSTEAISYRNLCVRTCWDQTSGSV